MRDEGGGGGLGAHLNLPRWSQTSSKIELKQKLKLEAELEQPEFKARARTLTVPICKAFFNQGVARKVRRKPGWGLTMASCSRIHERSLTSAFEPL